MSAEMLKADLLVLGGGPGGYTAAFRAADLGLSVVLVEKQATLGGVCLNVGCIPSKALLHTAKVMEDALDLTHMGVDFERPKLRLDTLRNWKEQLIAKLCGGLAGLARQRKVQVVTGKGRFIDPHKLAVEGGPTIHFEHAIIAVGSSPATLPVFLNDPRIRDSSAALELADIPGRMLVVGGGIIGAELASVYSALGSKVTIVELTAGLLPGCDRDLVKPLEKRMAAKCEAMLFDTQVVSASLEKSGVRVAFTGRQAPAEQVYDRVLVSVGRRPNGKQIGAEQAGVSVDERGYIAVDAQQR